MLIKHTLKSDCNDRIAMQHQHIMIKLDVVPNVVLDSDWILFICFWQIFSAHQAYTLLTDATTMVGAHTIFVASKNKLTSNLWIMPQEHMICIYSHMSLPNAPVQKCMLNPQL